MGKQKPQTIAAYIEAAPEGARGHLRDMLACLRETAPKADEGIKWGMPALSYKRILFTFAGWKDHIGFYPTPAALNAFAKEIKSYSRGAGSIQFPLSEPLPVVLISRIAACRVRDVTENDAKWM